ncbi:glycosyltransferase family 2 protein [Brucellaceae bacterium C25G]
MDYSVVIPVYNGADTIEAAIASVLMQSPPPHKVIVIDDGSTDNTALVVAALDGPITLIRQQNSGPGAATTLGFTLVETALIATLDADDLWLPEKMSVQIKYLQNHPEVSAVFCPLANFHNDPASADFAGASGGWSRTTMLIRTKDALSVGAIIDPQGRAGEMIDWFARAKENGLSLVLLPEVLALRRIRPGSLTWGNNKLGQSYLQVARAALLRRRAASKVRGHED